MVVYVHALKGLLQGFCLENEGQGGLGYMCGESGSGKPAGRRLQ